MRSKKLRNGNRSLHVEPSEYSSAAMQPAPAETPPPTEPLTYEPSSEATASLCLEGVTLDEDTLASSPLRSYVGMVMSLIVGRRVGRAELLNSLRRTLRQHRIGRRRRIEYVLGVLHQHPP